MRIPNQAQCVFKGIIFDVYQWKQRMFDGSYETFEALKRPDTVQIIATSKNKICLLQEEQPTKTVFYGLPGGRQEKNETSVECARRELLEETGLVSDNWQLLKTYEPFHKMEWFVYVFIARECKKAAAQKLDTGEKIKVNWVSFDTFITTVTGKKFWGRELTADVLKAKLSRKGLDDLQRKLFSKKS